MSVDLVNPSREPRRSRARGRTSGSRSLSCPTTLIFSTVAAPGISCSAPPAMTVFSPLDAMGAFPLQSSCTVSGISSQLRLRCTVLSQRTSHQSKNRRSNPLLTHWLTSTPQWRARRRDSPMPYLQSPRPGASSQMQNRVGECFADGTAKWTRIWHRADHGSIEQTGCHHQQAQEPRFRRRGGRPGAVWLRTIQQKQSRHRCTGRRSFRTRWHWHHFCCPPNAFSDTPEGDDATARFAKLGAWHPDGVADAINEGTFKAYGAAFIRQKQSEGVDTRYLVANITSSLIKKTHSPVSNLADLNRQLHKLVGENQDLMKPKQLDGSIANYQLIVPAGKRGTPSSNNSWEKTAYSLSVIWTCSKHWQIRPIRRADCDRKESTGAACHGDRA